MPLPPSGDGRILGQKPGTSKIKSVTFSARNYDPEWKVDEYKNKKYTKSTNSNGTNTQVDLTRSPGFQHIIYNQPTLDISTVDNFTYDYTMITDSSGMPINNCSTDNESFINNTILESGSTNTKSTHSTLPGFTYTNYNVDQQLKYFNSDYNGPSVIIIEFIDSNLSTGSWHPLKWVKFLTKNFQAIINIKPNGHKKVKITFESIICLRSPLLTDHNLSACRGRSIKKAPSDDNFILEKFNFNV